MEQKEAGGAIPTVQWFPGHMAKTKRLIQGNLKSVDVVIELLDARVPTSSANPLIREIVGEKPRLVALNKADLADEAQTKKWIACFRSQGLLAVPIDSLAGTGLKALVQKAEALAKPKTHKLVAKGAKPRAARAMVLGIPNVGKSSLINRLAGAAKAKVENRPGVTRDKQWIRIGKNLELLDMPGILWPKFEDPKTGLHIAFIGSINDDILFPEDMAYELIQILIKDYPQVLNERYGIEIGDGSVSAIEILEMIGKKRGCLKKGAEIDLLKTSKILIEDFRTQKLGKITLEMP